MLIMITGTPGASKTLNTIKMVNENPHYKDRPIYYHDIKELTFEWKHLDDPTKWFDLPDGSVIIIDECQKVFPNRSPSAKVPDHVARIAEHRHQGMDIILVTQHPNDVDNFVRRRVNEHYHLKRINNSSLVRRFKWNEYVNPDSKANLNSAVEEESIKIDKKYFGTYKSAEVHTHKTKIPKRILIYLGIGISLIAFAFYRLFSGDGLFSGVSEKTEQVHIEGQQHAQTRKSIAYTGNPYDDSRYEPRIKTIPKSAPVYDELFKVVSAPEVHCISNSNLKCICYDQQLIKYHYSWQECKSVMAGRFDPTKPDRDNTYTEQNFDPFDVDLPFTEELAIEEAL